MGFFTAPKPEPPPTVPTDEVIPLHILDGNRVVQAILLEFTYKFDDVLDVVKLRNSLNRLLEIGEWRKLGARLRLNSEGKPVYHIPERYDEERPGINFSHLDHGIDIARHSIASQIPQTASIPTIFGDPEQFIPVVHGSNRIMKFDDWISSDQPVLCVHVGSFNDATLLTISFSHAVFDAIGLSVFLKAWLCVLDDREDDLPPFVGYHVDPIASIVDKVQPERHVLYDKVLSKWGSLVFFGSLLLDFLQYPKQETRTILLPGKFVKCLHAEAMDDLRRSGDIKDTPFLSEGDVLFAWWAKITCAAQDIRPTRPLRLGNFFTIRGMFKDVLPPESAFVGNALSVCYSFMTTAQLLARPMGIIALGLRQALAQQRTEEQVQASYTLLKQLDAAGRFLLFAPANAFRITMSSWHKGKFFDMDFSAAVTKPGVKLEERKNKLGCPSYINYTGQMTGMRNSGQLLGRDANGDWWMQWTLRTDAWSPVGNLMMQETERYSRVHPR